MTGVRMLVWFALALGAIAVELRWGRRAETDAHARSTDDLMVLATAVAVIGGPVAALTLRGGPFHLGAWSIAMGAVTGVAGLWLRTSAMRVLGRRYTLTPTILDDHTLVVTGPYRRIRHPGYTGIILQLLGLAFCTGSLPAVVLVAPVVAVLPLRVRVEERLLAEAFGPAYEEYCRWTPHRFVAGLV
jgi:protein-S-isoprenylcysteine O-methyltransferase Ste14